MESHQNLFFGAPGNGDGGNGDNNAAAMAAVTAAPTWC